LSVDFSVPEIDMNWEALGAIAELVGAVSVLVTLLYLARQIRQNRESVESASAETVLSNISNALQNAASSSQVSNVILSGSENIGVLTEQERGQFLFWMYSYFRILEQGYHHYLTKNFTSSIWEGHARHAQTLLSTPGVMKYWELRREVFSPEFQKYIDFLASQETETLSSISAVRKLGEDDIAKRSEGL
jgi:hypothetical protein